MPLADDIRRLELAQLDMTAGLFTVLDSILSSIAPPVPKIKAGGYPDDVFINMTEGDKEQFECSICFMILKDAQQCKNKHKFCSSCIMAWTLTSTSQGADKCPVCRTEGEYVPCDILNARLSYKRVKCQEENCDWTGFLKDYDSHQHNQYDAPLKPGVKRSLPAVPGTIRPAGAATGPRPGMIPRPTASRVTGDSRSGSQRTIAANAPGRLVNRSQAPNAPNRGGLNATAGTSPRPAPQPTPRSVRERNRQNATNASTIGQAGNNTRHQTNAPSNTSDTSNTIEASRAQENGDDSAGITPRPNSVARAPRARPTNQTAGSQTRTSLASNDNGRSTPTPQEAAASQTTEVETGANMANATTPRIQATLLLRRRSSTPNRITPVRAADASDPSATSTNTTRESHNSREDVPPDNRPTHLPPISAARLGNDNARTYRQTQFRQMADQIREGRSQLQDIMHILNGELETRRLNIARHREFQERQHQERLRQLSEVHNLGQRLGEVASNLAGLMSGLRGGRPVRRGLGDMHNDD